MSVIEEITLSKELFLHKSTIMYGESNTGKSVIIRHILKLIRNDVGQIQVICPTDPQNKNYSKEPDPIAPTPCIHSKLTAKWLEDFWRRQTAHMAIYKAANALAPLSKLFSRLNLRNVQVLIDEANKKREDCIYEIRKNSEDDDEDALREKIEEINEEFNEFLALLYKKYISESIYKFKGMQLTDAEKNSLKFINFDPSVAIVFDDCSEDLKVLKDNEILSSLFTKGRHHRITVIAAVHSDKYVSSEVRKQGHNQMWLLDKTARAYFNRVTNDYSSEEKREMNKIIKEIDWKNFQKILFVRSMGKYFKFKATKCGTFRFGSPIIHEFLGKYQNDDTTISADNEFAAELLNMK